MIKRFFAKINMLWRRVPLQARVVFNVALLAAILSIPIYILSYEIPLINNMEARFRWEEKRKMVGPSEILAVLDVNAYTYFTSNTVKYDRLIIAETQESVVLCGYNTQSDKAMDCDYRSKSRDLTVIPAMNVYTHNGGKQGLFVLVDDWPDAVRAEVSIKIEEKEAAINLSAHREYPGCFVLYGGGSSDGLYLLHDLTNYGRRRGYVAWIRLYNADNQLICNKSITYD